MTPDAVRRAAVAGLCANLVGIGLARFAYTPLLPALVSGQWFSESAAAYLGAANFAGYLVGASLGHNPTRWLSPATVLRAMMLLTAASLFACEFRQLGFAWFFVWRLISGYTGGAIMVLAAPTVLARTPWERRGIVGGAIFTGVGLGVAASGTLVPLLLRWGGLEGAWIGLGALSLLLTLVAWPGWPPVAVGDGSSDRRRAPARLSLGVGALLAEYGLNAAGLVPHMLFLVIFVAHGLGRGFAAGAGYWVLFGLGATAGPLLTGRLADLVGFQRAIRLAFLVQAVAVAIPVFADGAVWLALSSVIAGAFTPGIVPLALGRVHELIDDPVRQRRAWGHATTAWALAQAAGGYGFAFLLNRFGSYPLLFSLAALALFAALALDIAMGIFCRQAGGRGERRTGSIA